MTVDPTPWLAHAHAVAKTQPRKWTVRILGVDTVPRELSLNGRPHWGAKVRAKRALADAVILSVRAMPRQQRPEPLQRARIELHWRPGTVRPRDTDNPSPALKVCCDVLVRDFALVPDDDYRHVESAVVIHEPGVPALWLTITEVLGDE